MTIRIARERGEGDLCEGGGMQEAQPGGASGTGGQHCSVTRAVVVCQVLRRVLQTCNRDNSAE